MEHSMHTKEMDKEMKKHMSPMKMKASRLKAMIMSKKKK